jgi:hypothetical protein
MVWQDCMLAGLDPPPVDEFAHAIDAEVTQVLTRLQGRPAARLVCGSSETYQRAAMFGLQPGTWESAVLEETIPAVVERVLPEPLISRRADRRRPAVRARGRRGALLRRRRVRATAL